MHVLQAQFLKSHQGMIWEEQHDTDRLAQRPADRGWSHDVLDAFGT